jgi:hypothetical protein
MATYKVIQDIEAEDKLLGPLTLRQFIYAAIVIVQVFIAFKIATATNFVVFVPFLPTIVFFGLLAAPFGQNQSSEVWLLAKIRFMLKPRKRIWDQTGMKQLVSITAPKKVETHLTDGLTQTEVKSRLQALANTIDSRGWAIKNVNTGFSNPAFAAFDATASDRLVSPALLPQDVPTTDVYAADDIMDGSSNTTAQALDTMLAQSTQAHLQTVAASVQAPAADPSQATQPANYWFMNQADPAAVPAGKTIFAGATAVTPGNPGQNTAADTGLAEQALLQRIHAEKARNAPHHERKIIKHLGDQRAEVGPHPPHAKPHKQDDTTSTPPPIDPKLAQLATNDDLNVATIAREADKAAKPLDATDGEVVISLR